MPATWGYGNTGSEPITMAGWGMLTDLEGVVSVAVAIELESVSVTQYGVTPTVVQYGVTATVTQYGVTTTLKNDLA